MAEGSQDTHHPEEEIRSDLDLLIDMAKDAQQDERTIERHWESLKAKVETLVHSRGARSGGSAS
jgi:hypothetical protein